MPNSVTIYSDINKYQQNQHRTSLSRSLLVSTTRNWLNAVPHHCATFGTRAARISVPAVDTCTSVAFSGLHHACPVVLAAAVNRGARIILANSRDPSLWRRRRRGATSLRVAAPRLLQLCRACRTPVCSLNRHIILPRLRPTTTCHRAVTVRAPATLALHRGA